MMDIERSRKLLADIRANQDKLNACPLHAFDLPIDSIRFGAKWTCKNCGGTMDGIAVLHYAQGYAAAGKDPSDIAPGWGKPL